MIIVKLIGGLGNQLFQYAFARAVAQKKKCEFKLDVSGFGETLGSVTSRQYALESFQIEENIATTKEAQKLSRTAKTKLGRFLQLVWWKFIGNHNKQRYDEKGFAFQKEVFEFTGDRYFAGFWQSEKYFQEAAEIIKGEFQLKPELAVAEKEIARKIRKVNAVSLHIRRGDFISNSGAHKFHGVCSLEYYAKAAAYIAERVENPYFFIFSDDIAWVKENLHLEYPMEYVSDDKLRDFEELTLMSLCKHNIVANSSFSWWGAWLNANSAKIVIAPQQWFAHQKTDTRDVAPESWIKM